MEEDRSEEFVFVGSFTPGEIQKVTHHIEELGIDYEVEFDDSDIRDMSPAAAMHGLFGTATVKLFVDPEKMLEVEAVIETLYPP